MQATWPQRPVLYEINTHTWLYALALRYQRPITLGTVPAEVWDEIAALPFDAVWLMGVWERSPLSVQLANEHSGLQAEFWRALPDDYSVADNIGSAYSVRRYIVDARLGGPEGLATARQMLAQRGLRLLLDFVPNHVALDHPWVYEHPTYFVQGTPEELARSPEAFFTAGAHVIANGRDPYFPPWRDTAQVNAFSPGLRAAALETLLEIGAQCDGVRCDMAMLLLNRTVANIWGERAGEPPAEEYWHELIAAVRQRYPQMLFLAEVYWDLERDLIQLGFDYCYDKYLYDRLAHDNARRVLLHLYAALPFQDKLARFIENHDEPRAAEVFSRAKECAAAVIIMTIPGAKLLYEGQLEGRRVRPPVFLTRRPLEPVDEELRAFYQRLLAAAKEAGVQEGTWQPCERSGWPDNASYEHLLAWTWTSNAARTLIVVNYSEQRSQAHIHLPWPDLAGHSWILTDVLAGTRYERNGDEMQNEGLHVDLLAWQFHFFRITT